MSITNELRGWMKGSTLSSWTGEHLTAIADRIDAEHAEAQRRWMAELDAARDRDGWVELPKDADGEYIHIGDVVVGKEDGEEDFIFEVYEIAFFSGGSCNVRAANDFGFDPWKVSHHKQPTVEDVLEQFAVEVERAGGAFDVADDVWTRFAAKLRLAGEGE